ncbi:hypothetical protein [Micrococcus sp.]|uniref:hypothetical protein n=1 Tax=Micrococcus sp. TaxID=1271 RepID=UPI002A90F573|nr:hypothetical protein [Micrococcus sp.]MDY6055961.1 hypothetical protein [Micrococcus sp.]
MTSTLIRAALSVPLAFSILVVVLGLGSVVLPGPVMTGMYALSLLSPIVAAAGMTFAGQGAWSGRALAVVLVCSALRIVLFVLNSTDPGSYYVWPVDAVLSAVLFFVGWMTRSR